MKYFKGTAKQYADLNKAISDRFHYPDFGTSSYYTDQPRKDVAGKYIMEVDGFIIDMMPDVFTDVTLSDSVDYPPNPDV